MKKYKRTRIIANLAVMGSLAWSSTTFAASTTPVTWGTRVKDNTNISISRPTRERPASSTPEFRKKKERGDAVRLKQGVMSLKHVGEVVSLNADGFMMRRGAYGRHASSTAQSTYVVATSASTVYMRDGKLDSVTDLAPGARVLVTGTLDAATATITAEGINILSGRRK
ncbi:MAG: hypothetical protein AAB365_01905 [Patescibacteria group bacterium]